MLVSLVIRVTQDSSREAISRERMAIDTMLCRTPGAEARWSRSSPVSWEQVYKHGDLQEEVSQQGKIPTQDDSRTLLQQLRQRRYNRFIWIDAICINQEDSVEKSLEILMMRDLYEEAKRDFCLGSTLPLTPKKKLSTACLLSRRS